MYCSRCQLFCKEISCKVGRNGLKDGKLVWSPVTTQLHENVKSLRVASDAGCSICRNIWCSWSSKDQREVNSNSSVYIEIFIDQELPMLKAYVKSVDGTDAIKATMMGMYLGITLSGTGFL
jgi:hypothetical protein